MHKDLMRGIKGAVPVMLGYLPIGFAFGVLAVQQGLGVLDILFMSLFVYAGSAQFIAANLIASGAGAVSIVFTTFLVNLRHLLMSASLSPHVKKFSSPLLALISFGITDESYAVSITQVQKEEVSPWYFAGLHGASHSAWILSTVLGGLLGGLIPDPGRWGVDFALSAMFIGLLIMQLDDRKDLLVSLCSGLFSIIIALNFEGGWNIILASLLAATIGVGVEQWTKKSSLSLSE